MKRTQPTTTGRVETTRQSIITSSFHQMPRFLTSGEFAGNKLSNDARVLYTLMLDRYKVSLKNGWFDNNDEIYIYFKKEEMENQLGLSKMTVLKVMRELKNHSLVRETKQGLNRPNKIYLLSPVVASSENLAPYLSPEMYNSSDTE